MRTAITTAMVFISVLCVAQSKVVQPKSDVKVTGDKNVIRVIQADVIQYYDLGDDNDSKALLASLKNAQGFMKDFGNFQKAVIEILKSANAKVPDSVVFYIKDLEDKVAAHKNEIQKLREANSELLQKTDDIVYAEVLKKAGEKLDEYDHVGYQKILEDHKSSRKSKYREMANEIASASFLQAKDNLSLLHYSKALEQIEEALKLRPENEEYSAFKADVLRQALKYQQSIDEYERLISVTSSDSLRVKYLGELGQTHSEAGNLKAALTNTMLAKELGEKMLTNDSTAVAKIYYMLGWYHYQLGNLGWASLFTQKAHSIYDRSLQDWYMTAYTRNLQGLIYGDLGQLNASLYELNFSLYLFQRISDNEKYTSHIKNNIGNIHRELGNFDTALNNFDQSLAAWRNLYGELHPYVAGGYSNIALVLAAKELFDTALRAAYMAVSIQNRLGLSKHQETGNYLRNIGHVYALKGNFDSAFKYCTQAHMLALSKYDTSSIRTAYSYAKLGDVYKLKCNSRKKRRRAIDYYSHSLQIRETTMGSNYFYAAETHEGIGDVYLADKNKKSAKSHYTQAYHIYRNELGEDARKTNNVKLKLERIK